MSNKKKIKAFSGAFGEVLKRSKKLEKKNKIIISCSCCGNSFQLSQIPEEDADKFRCPSCGMVINLTKKMQESQMLT